MSSSSDQWGCLFWLLAGAAAVWFCGAIWGDLWYSKLAYELYYSIDSSHLTIEKEPHDCDFWKAPIGKKECDYRRVVSTVEIGISTTTNRPVQSWDGGKTWSDFTPAPGTAVPQNATVTDVANGAQAVSVRNFDIRQSLSRSLTPKHLLEPLRRRYPRRLLPASG